MPKIDWASKRIQRLNIVVSCIGFGLIGGVMIWEFVSKGTLELARPESTGLALIIWFMGQIAYANKLFQKRLLDRLKAAGVLE